MFSQIIMPKRLRSTASETAPTQSMTEYGTMIRGNKMGPRRKYKIKRAPKVQVGFPQIFTTRMKYAYQTSLSYTAGAPGKLAFNLNAIYSINSGTLNHSPLYFSQFSAIYNHWVVLSAFARFTFTPQGATVASYVGVLDDDDGTIAGGTNPNTFAEQTNAVVRSCLPAASASSPIVLTSKYDAVKEFGPNPLANTSLVGTGTSNPSETYTAVAWMASADATTSISCFLNAEIWYTVSWVEPKTMATS